MSTWRQVPAQTKIYLAILSYLVIILILLALARAAYITFSWSMLHDWLLPGTPIPSTQDIALVRPEVTASPTMSFPPGVPWLRANVNAPIRVAPDENSAIVALLEVGKAMPVVGISADGGWFAVELPYYEINAGWISAAQVLSQNVADLPVLEAASKPGLEQKPTDTWSVAEALTNVNIRSGPGTNYPRTGMLEIGQVMPVVAISPDELWLAIQSPVGEVGWVARSLVAARNMSGVPVGTPAPPLLGNNGAATPAPGTPYLRAVWTVNVRAGPGQEYAVVGKLEQGQAAEIVGTNADGIWWAIRYPNGENERGWVAAAYVETQNAAGVPVLR